MSTAAIHPRRGVAGARARWGEAVRVCRLDSLTIEQRNVVVALVEALKAAQAAATEAHDAAPSN